MRVGSLILLVTSGACGVETSDTQPPTEWVAPASGMEFVLLEPGEFTMGLAKAPDDLRPAPTHPVRITQPFYMGRFEVTQSQWFDLMGTRPSQHAACPDCPVESVSWDDARRFTTALEAAHPGEVFRLPTEAEWEYACRSGNRDRYGVTDTLRPELANYDSRIPFEGLQDTVFVGRTTPVGSFPENQLGLHDMIGNVWEWTGGEFCPYPNALVVDPVGQCGTDTIPIRGGSWYFSANAARCGRRYTHARGDSGFSLGFRVVREMPPVIR